MKDLFEIAMQRDRKIVHATIRGFWTDDVANAFEEAICSSLSGLDNKSWSFICDASEFPVQAGPLVARSQAFMTEVSKRCGGRAVIVVAGALTSIQAKRVLAGQPVAITGSLADARRLVGLAAAV